MKILNKKKSTGRRFSSRGFTLIETLLGICIFSILSVCVFSTYSAGMKISRKAETFNQFYRDVNLSLMTICREIESMVIFNLENSYPEKRFFEGKSDSMAFVLPEEDGLKRICYSLVPAASSHLHQILIGQTTQSNVAVTTKTEQVFGESYLIREERPLSLFLSEEESEGDEMILGTKIKSGGLRFWYGLPDEDEAGGIEWKDAWEFDGYPQLVKVELDYYAPGEAADVKTIAQVIYIPTGVAEIKKDTEVK